MYGARAPQHADSASGVHGECIFHKSIQMSRPCEGARSATAVTTV